MNPPGLILVSTHGPERHSSGAGETADILTLRAAVRNSSRVPGPGVIVASYATRLPSAALDPQVFNWISKKGER